MALMLTLTLLQVGELASALRVSLDNHLEVYRLGSVAEALIEKRAGGAPKVIKQEAVIRIAGYLYDMPESPSGDRYASAWRNSGAGSLLDPWIVRRAGAIE